MYNYNQINLFRWKVRKSPAVCTAEIPLVCSGHIPHVTISNFQLVRKLEDCAVSTVWLAAVHVYIQATATGAGLYALRVDLPVWPDRLYPESQIKSRDICK
jgi:hypothetical protein